jgi:phosphate transport system protein
VPEELRKVFHRSLEEIDRKIVQLFALVCEGISGATDAFLAGDRDAAKALFERERLVDELYAEVESLVQTQLLLQSPMAEDARFLLCALRIVPELERTGDLAEHVAAGAVRGLAAELTPRARGLVEQLGAVATEMWRQAADAYVERDGLAADRLRDRDDEMDELHASLTAELASGSMRVPVVLEMGLIARFFERLGDHAVNVSERIKIMAGSRR